MASAVAALLRAVRELKAEDKCHDGDLDDTNNDLDEEKFHENLKPVTYPCECSSVIIQKQTSGTKPVVNNKSKVMF